MFAPINRCSCRTTVLELRAPGAFAVPGFHGHGPQQSVQHFRSSPPASILICCCRAYSRNARRQRPHSISFVPPLNQIILLLVFGECCAPGVQTRFCQARMLFECSVSAGTLSSNPVPIHMPMPEQIPCEELQCQIPSSTTKTSQFPERTQLASASTSQLFDWRVRCVDAQ